jgi:hypothetical protein
MSIYVTAESSDTKIPWAVASLAAPTSSLIATYAAKQNGLSHLTDVRFVASVHTTTGTTEFG